jgi:hypothetical protein
MPSDRAAQGTRGHGTSERCDFVFGYRADRRHLRLYHGHTTSSLGVRPWASLLAVRLQGSASQNWAKLKRKSLSVANQSSHYGAYIPSDVKSICLVAITHHPHLL